MVRAIAYNVGVGSHFDPHIDPRTNGIRWRTWVRNFNYYIEGQIGLTANQKIARLLYHAGPTVQDIYETLGVEANAKDDLYEVAVKKLTQYFVPKTNIIYERQLFRNLDMSMDETVQQYVIRLRNAAKYCEFTDLDDVM